MRALTLAAAAVLLAGCASLEAPFGERLESADGQVRECAQWFVQLDAQVAAYVTEREWHSSQRVEDRADGSVIVTLDVCIDPALRSWILSFGPYARVIAPRALAEEILEELEEAREKYTPRMEFEAPTLPRLLTDSMPRLPFLRPS